MITLFITTLLTLGAYSSAPTTYQDNNNTYEQNFDVREGDVAKNDENEGNN